MLLLPLNGIIVILYYWDVLVSLWKASSWSKMLQNECWQELEEEIQYSSLSFSALALCKIIIIDYLVSIFFIENETYSTMKYAKSGNFLMPLYVSTSILNLPVLSSSVLPLFSCEVFSLEGTLSYKHITPSKHPQNYRLIFKNVDLKDRFTFASPL